MVRFRFKLWFGLVVSELRTASTVGGWLKAVPTWNIHEHAKVLLTRTAGEWQKELILAFCLISLFSWWGASLIWRQTSSSRMCKVSAAWWSCWSTATSPARLKSGPCSPPSSEKVFETCKWAPRWASSSRCCKDGAQWMTLLQVVCLGIVNELCSTCKWKTWMLSLPNRLASGHVGSPGQLQHHGEGTEVAFQHVARGRRSLGKTQWWPHVTHEIVALR